jgi:hypothetical protein
LKQHHYRSLVLKLLKQQLKLLFNLSSLLF